MPFEGMDVDTVLSLASQLNHQAETINSTINAIDGLVNQMETSWKGQDATQFNSWWQTQHKPALNQAMQAVQGLSQSATNNANDQRNTSAH